MIEILVFLFLLSSMVQKLFPILKKTRGEPAGNKMLFSTDDTNMPDGKGKSKMGNSQK